VDWSAAETKSGLSATKPAMRWEITRTESRFIGCRPEKPGRSAIAQVGVSPG
jgi:hypothetical protein